MNPISLLNDLNSTSNFTPNCKKSY